MPLFKVYPLNDITITHAEGAFVWDSEGNRYLDMYGGHAVISIGHLHPHWVESIQKQLGKIAFYSNSVVIPQQDVLAEKLCRISGKVDYQLFLVNSGAEANENAMKLASFHTGRKKIIAFSKSFHGRTSLAVAATDNPAILAPVNETDNIVFLPFNDVSALETYFNQNGEKVAAVIVEGIQGVGGIQVASNIFLQSIRNLCSKHNAVYIADGVQCGYGRTGKFFAHDFAEVNADIYTMAKGMGNGFPVGGVLISPSIPAKFGQLGTTFGGNHLACAAAIAVLEVIESEELMVNAAKVGLQITEILQTYKGISNVRGKGLMIGFDLGEEFKNLRRDLLQDFFIFTGEAKPNTIRLLPSLALNFEEASMFIDAFQQAMKVG